MKFSTISLLTLFCSFLITGCDPIYHVDYQIVNSTEKSINIIVDNFGIASDTNVITSGTTLIFYRDIGIGSATCDYLDNLETIPVGLSIFDSMGRSFNRSEEDISNWRKFYPQNKSGAIGRVELAVRSEDFN